MSYSNQRSLSNSDGQDDDYEYYTSNGISYSRRRENTATKRYEEESPSRWEVFRYSSTKQPSASTSYQECPIAVRCGALRASDQGLRVRMRGSVDIIRKCRYIILRDMTGDTQLILKNEGLSLAEEVQQLLPKSEMEIIGKVALRSIGNINKSLPTGEIEVIIERIVKVVPPKKRPSDDDDTACDVPTKKARSSNLITGLEVQRCVTKGIIKRFLQRSHNCGELDESHVGLDVSLCGWVGKAGVRNNRFLDMLDGYGILQLHCDPTNPQLRRCLGKLKVDELIMTRGIVCKRDPKRVNYNFLTGKIELMVKSLNILDPNDSDEETSSDEEETNADASSIKPNISETSKDGVNMYCARTHTCSQLRETDVGKKVVMCGWFHMQRTNRFVLIRDGYGVTQLVIQPKLQNTLGEVAKKITFESAIKAKGIVCARPFENIVNERDPTGKIEVVLNSLCVLNQAQSSLPPVLRDRKNSSDIKLKLQYRYLDLRCLRTQCHIRLRSKVLMSMREFLINQREFVEVETPTLFRPLPWETQGFVVPTQYKDNYYSLIQSTHELKQLLMVGAMDRYFQVARCYRDESTDLETQPEFTQVDIALSFTDRDGIMLLVEHLLQSSWPENIPAPNTPFPVISYRDSMQWYGTDKPDLRMNKKFEDICQIITEDSKRVLKGRIRNAKNFTAKALVLDPNDVPIVSEVLRQCRAEQKTKSITKAKLKMAEIYDKHDWKFAIDDVFPFLDAAQLKDLLQFQIPCAIVIGIGEESEVLPLLAKVRESLIGSKEKTTTFINFAWIVDFPLFSKNDDGHLKSVYHPFTQPNPDDVHLLNSDPLKVKGLHFHLVANGWKVGAGSVCIHDAALLTNILQDVLKIPMSSVNHLSEVLSSGAPPHGEFTLDIDRLLAVLSNVDSIAEVIAFPKNSDGRDLMSGAPCAISDEEKTLYHLNLK